MKKNMYRGYLDEDDDEDADEDVDDDLFLQPRKPRLTVAFRSITDL